MNTQSGVQVSFTQSRPCIIPKRRIFRVALFRRLRTGGSLYALRTTTLKTVTQVPKSISRFAFEKMGRYEKGEILPQNLLARVVHTLAVVKRQRVITTFAFTMCARIFCFSFLSDSVRARSKRVAPRKPGRDHQMFDVGICSAPIRCLKRTLIRIVDST